MELYAQKQAQALRLRARCWSVAVFAAVALALVGCIVCCCLSSTATAERMERTAIILSTAAGWFVIFALTVLVFPNRYGAQHEENILCGERETVTGVISVEPEVLQIPKSIAICKVVVRSGAFERRLSVRADKVKLLQAYEGQALTLHTVYGYIAFFEEPHENC